MQNLVEGQRVGVCRNATLYGVQGLSLQLSPIIALGNTVLVSGQRKETLKGGSHLPPSSLYSLYKLIKAFLSPGLHQLTCRRMTPVKGHLEQNVVKARLNTWVSPVIWSTWWRRHLAVNLCWQHLECTRQDSLGPLLLPSMHRMASIFWAL